MSFHQNAKVLLLLTKVYCAKAKCPFDHPQHLHGHVGFKLCNLKDAYVNGDNEFNYRKAVV